MNPLVKTKLPGKKSKKILDFMKKKNGGASVAYPFVMGSEGSGPYFKDIDGNTFLDFGSLIASNPLGYNNPELKNKLKEIKNTPVKYAGQDFIIKEHKELIEELLTITPKQLNAAFLINSGAEAVENAMKICMRKRPLTKFGISFESAFHGRTLGALSLTNTKHVYKDNYAALPALRLPFDDSAAEKLRRIIDQEAFSKNIGFVIIEPIQGEGGYNIASRKLVKDIRNITKNNNIPLISDEVQAGMGRTGRWWSIENFNATPDIMTAAKALQVGATISNKKFFPEEQGAISSTWGGGSLVDLKIGTEIIKVIKRKKLLNNITKIGLYLNRNLKQLNVQNVRGIGLMQAFDLPSEKIRDNLIVESLKNGLVLLGCGNKGIRVIPPYIIKRDDVDKGIEIIDKSLKSILRKEFKHKGEICKYIKCGEVS